MGVKLGVVHINLSQPILVDLLFAGGRHPTVRSRVGECKNTTTRRVTLIASGRLGFRYCVLILVVVQTQLTQIPTGWRSEVCHL